MGISAIGAAIIGFEGEIAAITIPTPTVRFTKKQPELAKALRLCCDAIERISAGTASRVGRQFDSRCVKALVHSSSSKQSGNGRKALARLQTSE